MTVVVVDPERHRTYCPECERLRLCGKESEKCSLCNEEARMEAMELDLPRRHYKLTLESPDGHKSGLSFSMQTPDDAVTVEKQKAAIMARMEEALAALYRYEYQKMHCGELPAEGHWSMNPAFFREAGCRKEQWPCACGGNFTIFGGESLCEGVTTPLVALCNKCETVLPGFAARADVIEAINAFNADCAGKEKEVPDMPTVKTVSFDIGGVVDTAPQDFKGLMLRLRKDGCRVILVSAIGRHYTVPDDPEQRRWWRIGRLHAEGFNIGSHYDDCFITMDHGPESLASGAEKARVLIREKACCHVDDNQHWLAGMTAFQGTKIHFVGQSADHLYEQISKLAGI